MPHADLVHDARPTESVGSGGDYRQDVERVLALARRHLDMDVAWMSEFESGQQVFTCVDDGGTGFGPRPGTSSSLKDSYCLRVVDGRLPHTIADAQRHPVTRELPGTKEVGIGCYVGVPIRGADDSVLGMLCCAGRSPRHELGGEHSATLNMLAALLADLAERSGVQSRRHRLLYDRVAQAVAGQGLSVVLQPIIETHTGRLVGAEALARFAARESGPSASGPAAWFADADSVGLRQQLETAAARLALQRLPDLEDTATLTLNVSPDLITDGGLDALLPEVDVSRVVVEITEHAAVPDYGELHRALDAHRRAGLRLAVDDAGAGYASFRHILNLRPDLIKVDMSLVSRIDVDAAQQALVGSLLSFAENSGATLLAEGVETQGELDELARIGVPLVQGFLLARPTPPPLPPRYPTPTAIVLP